jgi:hypothetical protein
MRGGGGRAVVAAVLFIAASRVPAQLPGDATCDGTLGPDDMPATADGVFADGGAECPVTDGNGDGAATAADLVWLASMVAGPQPEGPVPTAFGLATADGLPIPPAGTLHGADLFVRNTGSGFQVIVEGRAGTSGEPPGVTMLDSDREDPTKRPDLQILSSQQLGDGSRQICQGGVPAVDPPSFGPSQAIADALNDLACRFVPISDASPCTVDEFGRPRFVGSGTQAQYCLVVARQQLQFPAGDTTLTLHLRDTEGHLGPVRQIVVRVGAPFLTPTLTLAPSPTATPSMSPAISASPTHSATPSLTWSPTGTLTPSASTTPTNVPTTPAAGPSATATPTPTASATPSPGGPTPSPSRTPSATRTPTSGPTTSPTATAGQAPTGTVTRSATRTLTPTRTGTAAATRTPTRSATATPVSAPGPSITFFGLARADDTLVDPSPDSGEIPIYRRTAGFGFWLVVEGRPGASGAALGRSSYDESGADFPDLQVVASRPLGVDPTTAVCDRQGLDSGGVPAVDPPTFDLVPAVIDAVNDLACRFRDGTDAPLGRGSADSCVYFESTSTYRFVASGSTLQFCGFVDGVMRFPSGDTLVTVRLRDVEGNVGAPAQLIVRVP